jgi:hypothetical protein
MSEVAKDFFISYADTDGAWAAWIAWELEKAGYSTILNSWDFRPGSNTVLQIDHALKQAKRIIVLLSPDYLNALYTRSEWTAALQRDQLRGQNSLLPIHISECHYRMEGLLGPIIAINLVGKNEIESREILLAGVSTGRIYLAWRVLTPAPPLYIYRNHQQQVNAVAWSPANSQLIASASADATVQVWNAATGDMLCKYQGHDGPVNSLTWSPDGTEIASASVDHTVHIWNSATGEAIRRGFNGLLNRCCFLAQQPSSCRKRMH